MTEGKNVLVVGRTGSGKSYLVKRLIADASRLVIYAPKREEHDWPGVTFDALVDPKQWRLMVAWWRLCCETVGRFRLIFRPADIFEHAEFDQLSALAYACGSLTLVAEEVMSYCTEKNIGQGAKRLLTAGRTRAVTAYFVTQRPFRIPLEIRSQCREAYLFATHEPQDLSYLEHSFGRNAAEAMQRLGQYEHVHWHDSGQVEIGKG